MTLQEKAMGRKYKLSAAVIAASTIILALPMFLTLLTKTVYPQVLTGGEYVSLIIGVLAIYNGANVFQKKVLTTAGIEEASDPKKSKE